MEFKKPKRKRFGAKIPQSQSLPVLFESISGITEITGHNSLWPVYLGTYSGDSVIVSSRDEMTSLYSTGFFGKGCLSRGYPTFGEVKKGIPPIIRKRQWKRRKIWMDQLLSFDFTSSSLESEKQVCDSEMATVSDNTAQPKPNKESAHSDYEDVEIIETESDENVSSNRSNKNACQSNISKGSCAPNLSPSNCKPISLIDNTSPSPSPSSLPAVMNVALGSNCSSGLDQNKDDLAYRLSSNENNSVVVIDDSGSDDEKQVQSPKPELREEPIKTAVETLNLTLEEAFFLSFGLGCLQVVDLQGIFLSLQGMWHLYKDSQPDFISSYVTYHYFRSKGWVVKPGAKFGGNFLLYKQGPPFYHASYIVLIEEVNNKFDNTRVCRQLSWTKIMGLNRIAETAGKEILLSQVEWPQDVTSEDLNNPNVISRFKIQEVLLRRWNSGQEREEKEY